MRKKALFVLAHLDDEAFSAGTIKKMTDDGIEVSILIICGNGNAIDDMRPGIFKKNLELMGASGYTFKYFDLTLPYLGLDAIVELKEAIFRVIDNSQCDMVFTNNSGDLHSDHRTVSELVRTVCRPRSCNVETLYECYVPGSTEYGTGTDEFKTIVDISNTIQTKQQCMLNYGRYLKGASSYETAKYSSQYYGDLYNFNYAEIFKMLWDRSL